MFHNMQKKAVSEDKKQTVESVNQEPRQQSINSSTTPITMDKKEETMNAPQTKDNQSSNASDNRVDIPGNNFNRPGQAPAAQGVRPSYPGASYPGAATSTPAYSPQPANEAETNGRKLVIGQGISLSGEIEACDHLIVEGTVEAALKGASNMDISETGSFYGTVEIEEATIAGRFEGDITVNGRLTIQSTGTIIGSITYKELAIEAGATVEGSVTPLNAQGVTRSGNKKVAPKAKAKVNQDNSAELPFSEKVAS